MELEARVAQLEKDLAECRAKVFFLEAINAQRQLSAPIGQPISKPEVPIIGDPITDLDFRSEGDASRPDPSPPRKLSPWTLRLRPKTYDEEAAEEALNQPEHSNEYLDKLTEEMFDGNT